MCSEVVYLTTASENTQTQSVLAFEVESGVLLWNCPVNSGGFPEDIHVDNSYATATPACNGEAVFAAFESHGHVWVYAVDFSGNLKWTADCGEYSSWQGFGSSPVLFDDCVIVALDMPDGCLVALSQNDGSVLWKVKRSEKFYGYSTPHVARLAGVDQILLPGRRKLAAYSPVDGRTLWEVPAEFEMTCCSPSTSGDIAVVSGGHRHSQTLAVKVSRSTSGKLTAEALWANTTKAYAPSLMACQQAVFCSTDNGIAHCWDIETGRELWKERIGGKFQSSPVAVGNFILHTDTSGITNVYRTSRTGFEIVIRNALGTHAVASPAVVDGNVFLRVGHDHGAARQEWLYCIGSGK